MRVKAHGGLIDIQGIVIAKVNEKLELEKIDVWYDPLDMFRQIARENTEAVADTTSVTGGCPFSGAAKTAASE